MAGRALRDSKDSAVQELERERQRTQEHRQAYDQLLATHRDVETKLSTQVWGGEVRLMVCRLWRLGLS